MPSVGTLRAENGAGRVPFTFSSALHTRPSTLESRRAGGTSLLLSLPRL